MIDEHGNVINLKGQVIFKADEIEEDGEIPAPFCYLKNKETMGLNMEMFGIDGFQFFNGQGGFDGTRSARSDRTEDYANEDNAIAPSNNLKQGN